jgi:multicomponent Na+:H+ antiporter subunit E
MKELLTYFVHFLIAIVATILVFVNTSISNHFAANLLVFIGFYLFLWLASFFYDRSHFVKIPLALNLFIFFLKELLIASMVIAWDVITPRSHVQSGVIALPLDARTNIEITILASLISLTPGTLSLDVSEDKRILYIHAVYIKNGDIEALKKEIKDGFEKKLLKLTRKYNG